VFTRDNQAQIRRPQEKLGTITHLSLADYSHSRFWWGRSAAEHYGFIGRVNYLCKVWTGEHSRGWDGYSSGVRTRRRRTALKLTKTML